MTTRENASEQRKSLTRHLHKPSSALSRKDYVFALEEHEGKVSIGARTITNLRFADGTCAHAKEEGN